MKKLSRMTKKELIALIEAKDQQMEILLKNIRPETMVGLAMASYLEKHLKGRFP